MSLGYSSPSLIIVYIFSNLFNTLKLTTEAKIRMTITYMSLQTEHLNTEEASNLQSMSVLWNIQQGWC